MRTNIKLTLAIGVALLALAPAVLAKTYRWVDENGKVHFSDRLPPEAAKQAREEVNSEGVTVKRVDRQKTPEEVAAERAVAKAAADAARKAEAERLANLALVNSYASESDLVRNYEQNLELIEQQIISTNADIELRQKNLDQLVARAAQSEQAGKPVEEAVTKLIKSEQTEIAKQKAFLESKEQDKRTAKAEFDAKLAKYREAVAKSKAAATPPAPGGKP
jgi:hypothetical protein